jgi:transposase
LPDDGPVQPIEYDTNPLIREARDSMLSAPTAYSEETAQLVIELIAAGYSIAVAANAVGLSRQTISRWAIEDKEGFYERFRLAKQVQALVLSDQMIEIADDASKDWETRTDRHGNEYEVLNQDAVQRSKLMIDTRKFIARHFLKHVFGEEPEKNAKLDALTINIDGRPIENAPLPGEPGAPIAPPESEPGDG